MNIKIVILSIKDGLKEYSIQILWNKMKNIFVLQDILEVNLEK